MSTATLISSAVGGRKAAAPKGAIRRRLPPPPGAPAKAATSISGSRAQARIAPPSPPPTQIPDTPAPPQPAAPRAPSQPAEPSPVAIPTPIPSAERPARQPSIGPPEAAPATAAPTENEHSNAQDGGRAPVPAPASSKKRKQDAASAKETGQPAKRVKRSSARSNDKIHAAVRKDQPVEPSAANVSAPLRSTARKPPTRRSKEVPAATTTSAENDPSTTQHGGRRPRFQLTPSNKRKRDPAPAKETVQPQPAKRVKRSSARSNDKVQSAIQQEEAAQLAASTGSQKTPRSTRSKAQITAKATVSAGGGAPGTQKAQTKRKDTTATQKSKTKPKDTTATQKTQAKRKDNSATEKSQAKRKGASTTHKPPTKRTSKPKSAEKVVNSDAENETVGTTEQEQQQEETESQQTAPKPRRKYRRRKKKQEVQQEPAERAEANEEAQADDDDSDSDPELHEIDPNTVTMWEVGGDKRHGKTSEREKKMAEIDWDEVARKRREAIEKAIASDVAETTEGPSGTAESQEQSTAPEGTATVGGVSLRVVNGQIVENEESLTIDRRAQAEAEAAQTSDPIEEETDLTKRINRMTHLNDRRRDKAERVPMWKPKSDAWSEEETDRFYEELRMWGTDFYIISTLFKPRSRKQIKNKFVREERLDPERINNALMGKQTKRMDLEHYAREVGRDVSEYTKYSGVRQAEDVIRADFADREQEIRDAIAEAVQDEQAKQKEKTRRAGGKKDGQSKEGQSKRRPRQPGKGPGRRKKKGDASMAGGGPAGDVVAGAGG